MCTVMQMFLLCAFKTTYDFEGSAIFFPWQVIGFGVSLGGF